LLTAINPRRSSSLKAIKQEIKELFAEHRAEIDSPYDALERLPQQQLSDYGVEVGNVEETYIGPCTQGGQRRNARGSVCGGGTGRSVTDREANGKTGADTLTKSPDLTGIDPVQKQRSLPERHRSQAA